MIIYRICREEFASQLHSSGRPNRWNKNNENVIYASGSISLCALELLAHSGGIRPAGVYRIMHIKVEAPDSLLDMPLESLPEHWQTLAGYPFTQQVGSEWYGSKESLILKVPSAIISQEYNFILNTRHEKFDPCVRLLETTDFIWDHRFPETDQIK